MKSKVNKKPFAVMQKVVMTIMCLSVFLVLGCKKQSSNLNEEEDKCMGASNIQYYSPCIKNVSLTDVDKAILDQKIKKYTAFSLDTKELSDFLHANGGSGQFRLRINDELDWTIDLEFYDLDAAERKKPCFKGNTTDGEIAWFTINDSTFSGGIFCGRNFYTICPVKYYNQSNDNLAYIAYHSLDDILLVELTSFGNSPPLSLFINGSSLRYVSFFEGFSRYLDNGSVFFVRGKATYAYQYGRKIKVVEDIKGNFSENDNEFFTWGSFGKDDHSALFLDNQDDLIMLLTNDYDRRNKIWESLRYEDVWGFPFPEKHGDYNLISGTCCIIKLSEGFVTGNYIFPLMWNIQTDILHWNDFNEILKLILNSKT